MLVHTVLTRKKRFGVSLCFEKTPGTPYVGNTGRYMLYLLENQMVI